MDNSTLHDVDAPPNAASCPFLKFTAALLRSITEMYRRADGRLK
ncbi:hypothetical protein ACTJIL_05265 [Luteimonas sp. 22616]